MASIFDFHHGLHNPTIETSPPPPRTDNRDQIHDFSELNRRAWAANRQTYPYSSNSKLPSLHNAQMGPGTVPEPELPQSPPSEIERHHYYDGLLSAPMLVARSNAADLPWTYYPHHPQAKVLGTIGTSRHPIVKAWDNGLAEEVQGILQGVQWTSINTLRIGEDLGRQNPITILISVLPGTTFYEVGISVAMRCRQILQERGIHDVHCEVCEGRVKNIADDDQPQTAADIDSSTLWRYPTTATSTYSATAPDIELSDCISSGMGPFDHPKAGTKGLYLRLKDEVKGDRMVSLTCRHVAIPTQMDIELGEYTGEGSGSPYLVVQPATSYVSNKIQILKDNIEEKNATIKKLQKAHAERGGHSSEAQIRHIQTLDHGQGDRKSLLRRWKSLEPPERRVSGHLLYSPFYQRIQIKGRESRWVCDWAIIELHQERFESSLQTLTNIPYFPAEFPSHREHIQEFFNEFKDNTNLPLREYMTDEELRGRIAEFPLKVAKTGYTTGFTMGNLNEINSITRTTHGEDELVSEEMCITGLTGAFSAAGDSGSAIWDQQGVVCGMLVAGLDGRGGQYDITYATPIERLLAHIRACGYVVELP